MKRDRNSLNHDDRGSSTYVSSMAVTSWPKLINIAGVTTVVVVTVLVPFPVGKTDDEPNQNR